MTDEQDKAQQLLDKARRTMSGSEIDLCERVVRGETHLLGDWTSRDDRRFFEWCLTNFAQYIR